MSIQRGAEKKYYIELIKTDGTADTSTSPSVLVSKDGGAFASVTNAATQVGTTNVWTGTLTATEMTADVVRVRAIPAGCIPIGFTLYTEADYTTTKSGYLDAAVTSRMATFTYTAPTSAADIATAVWGATSRTLSSYGSLVSDVVSGVWSAGARTITNTLLTAQNVWEYATRALTDKAGFTLSVDYDAAKTAATQTSITAMQSDVDDILAAIAAGPIIVTGPMDVSTGTLTITKGDAYGTTGTPTDHPALTWQEDGWIGKAWTTVKFRVGGTDYTASFNGTTGTISLTLTSAQSATLVEGRYDLVVTVNASDTISYTGTLALRTRG